ncbi:MAG: hypothetical protein U0800_12125 [Isosphaeraceae bacterium]
MFAHLLNPYWFAPPLVMAISLVYAASRHEHWPLIWKHAARLSGTILAMLGVAIAVLLLINSQL